MLTFVCFLWRDARYRYGERYGAHHVNVLRSMLDRHMSRGHKLVCVTDDPTGIDDRVGIVPLWDDHRKIGGTYTRLKLFAPEMKDVIAPRFMLLDLDCVIVGDLAPLWETTENFVTWRSFDPKTPYNTGMFLLRAGSLPHVWHDFKPPESLRDIAVTGMIGWEQIWISMKAPGYRTWGPHDGVLNYRYGLRGAEPPDDARIVMFPGEKDPSTVDDTWVKAAWR